MGVRLEKKQGPIEVADLGSVAETQEATGRPAVGPLDGSERVQTARSQPNLLSRVEGALLSLFRYPVRSVAAVAVGLSLVPFSLSGATLKSGDTASLVLPTAVAAVSPADALSKPGFSVEVKKNVRGAYFRKISSGASAQYGGITAKGKLPVPTFDPDRAFVSKLGLDHFTTGPLDRPSVYLGGRASGKELDAGLTWDRVYDEAGRATYTDRAGCDGRDPTHRFIFAKKGTARIIKDGTGAIVAEGEAAVQALAKTLVPNFAFRPYWRTSNPDEAEHWKQPKPGTGDNVYFYPGEDVALRVELLGPGRVRLAIAGDANFSADFRQVGWGGAKTAHSFKRVNAVDQFEVLATGERKGREKVDVLPTGTVAQGAEWVEVQLLDRQGRPQAPMIGAHFTEVRGGDLADRYDQVFRRSGFTKAGGERLDIVPNGR